MAVAVAICMKPSPTSGRRRKAATSWSFVHEVRTYVAPRGTLPVIDGDVFKPAWQKAPWSEPFVEIRGERDAPEGTGPTEAQKTRMKMMWDDRFLYVAVQDSIEQAVAVLPRALGLQHF